MRIILSLLVIAMVYYSFSYGLYLWKDESNKLASFGVMLLSLMGALIPIVFIYTRL